MPLETGNYISDLVDTNPPGTDPVSQGDDHTRLIKHVLKTTFPNIDGAVTASQDELNGGGVPVASMIPFAGIVAPAGFLICDGAEIDRTTYSALFDIIGTAYGAGNDSSTFNLPDMRDSVMAGSSVTNLDASSAGTEYHVITDAQMPSHSHSVGSNGSHIHTINAGLGGAANGSDSNVADFKNTGSTGSTNSSGNHNHSLSTSGSDSPVDMRQPTIYMKYIIKT